VRDDADRLTFVQDIPFYRVAIPQMLSAVIVTLETGEVEPTPVPYIRNERKTLLILTFSGGCIAERVRIHIDQSVCLIK